MRPRNSRGFRGDPVLVGARLRPVDPPPRPRYAQRLDPAETLARVAPFVGGIVGVREAEEETAPPFDPVPDHEFAQHGHGYLYAPMRFQVEEDHRTGIPV